MTTRLVGPSGDVLNKALRGKRDVQRHVMAGQFGFEVVRDHIMPSICRHEQGDTCQICLYKTSLELPETPEMIFPYNRLWIADCRTRKTLIEFTTLDALKLVDAHNLPGFEVGPSAAWRASRSLSSTKVAHPFDWTFTTPYDGTLGPGVIAEETEEEIDIEKLKRRDPILFYEEITLFEDEISDHGCSMFTVRIRVMPSSFFVLARLYLRVDGVMVRICDTRLFAEADDTRVLREWSQREAQYSELSPEVLNSVRNADAIAQHLPVVKRRLTRIPLPSREG